MSDDRSSAGCPKCGREGHWGGAEHDEIYDGILYYVCFECDSRWHRWPEGSELRAAAAPFVGEP